jgi:hypothetical protein
VKKLYVQAGERFNKLTVMEMLGTNELGFSVARCRCDCGSESIVRAAELRSGHRRSCGCSSWKSKRQKRDAEVIGKTFSRLTVISEAGTDSSGYRLVNCECECGCKVKIRTCQMVAGDVQSCGCLQREKAMENLDKANIKAFKHGMSGTLTGQSWNCMMQRCYNPYSEIFHRYGAVGITACSFIKASPVNLAILIGNRPSQIMSLDRIENDKGYWCGGCEECLTNGRKINVRWATPSEQALNRDKKRFVEIDGVTKRASEWCEILNLPKGSKLIYTYPKANDQNL